MIVAAETPFANAIGAATEPTTWDVTKQVDVTVSGLAATLVEAVALKDTGGDHRRHVQLRLHHRLRRGRDPRRSGRPARPATPAYDTNTSVATLMAAASTFTPPG